MNKPRLASQDARRGALRGIHAAALALLSGILYFLAFPGIELWPLSFVAWVPLLLAMHGQSAKGAFWLAWLAGFAMTMTGFYWLIGMLRTFSGFGTPLCILFMAILCAYQAGRVGFGGWLYARASQRGWQPDISFLLAFVASELLFPLLFPWYFGATVHQVPALAQAAELGGPIGVGLPIVAANLALAELVIARWEKRAVRRRTFFGLLAVPLASALYGVIRIPAVDTAARTAPKLHVGLVQANMSLLGKRHDPQEGLRRHLDFTRKLQKSGPLDLVVWSETSVMSAVDERFAERQLFLKFTRNLGVPALFGSVLVREVEDSRQYVLFNSALLTNRAGLLAGRYDKRRLLAFGEYLPFGDTFPILYSWSPNSSRFSPGTSLTPLPLGAEAIATFICYDDIIPALGNEIVKRGNTGLLANLTNDAWFGDTTEPWIHLALAQFRAIEHRRFFVRSTNSGVSAFIDPVGRVMSHTNTFTEETLRADLAWLHPSTTPYEFWGDSPWWLASLASIAFAFLPRRRRGSAPLFEIAPTAHTRLDDPRSELSARSTDLANSSSDSRSFRVKSQAFLKRSRKERGASE